MNSVLESEHYTLFTVTVKGDKLYIFQAQTPSELLYL